MMRMVAGTLILALAGFVLPAQSVSAQTAEHESLAPRRPLKRIPIYPREEWRPDVYPRYNPGPNAVRVCTATYVQEHRPSGTVITPRMNCHWRPG
jgi:hypothetical protein